MHPYNLVTESLPNTNPVEQTPFDDDDGWGDDDDPPIVPLPIFAAFSIKQAPLNADATYNNVDFVPAVGLQQISGDPVSAPEGAPGHTHRCTPIDQAPPVSAAPSKQAAFIGQAPLDANYGWGEQDFISSHNFLQISSDPVSACGAAPDANLDSSLTAAPNILSELENDPALREVAELLTARKPVYDPTKAQQEDSTNAVQIPADSFAARDLPGKLLSASKDLGDHLLANENSMPRILRENGHKSKKARSHNHLQCMLEDASIDSTDPGYMCPPEGFWGGPGALHLKLEGGDRDPHIMLELADFKQSNVFRCPRIIFRIGSSSATGQLSDIVSASSVPLGRLFKDEGGQAYLLEIRYRNIVITGDGELSNPAHPHVVATLKDVRSVKVPTTPNKIQSMTLLVQLLNGNVSEKYLHEILHACNNPPPHLNMSPYLKANSNDPQLGWNEMPSRQYIYEAHEEMGIYGIPRFAQSNYYKSISDAAITSAYGNRLEYEYKRARSDLLTRASHTAAFRFITPSQCCAYIRLDMDIMSELDKQGKTTEDFVVWPYAGERFALEFYAFDEIYTVHGILKPNTQKDIDASLMLQLERAPECLSEIADWKPEAPDWCSARFIFDAIKWNYLHTHENIVAFWRKLSFAHLRKALLGYRWTREQPENIFDECDVTPDEAKAAIDKVKALETWTEQQLEVLDHAHAPPDRWGIIFGPGGTGKSKVLAGLAAVYIGTGKIDCLCLAQTHVATDALFEKVSQYCERLGLQQPIRFRQAGIALQQLGTTRCVVSTLHGARNGSLRKSFAKIQSSCIVLIDDGSQAREISIIDGIAGATKWRRLEADSASRNPIRAIWVAGDTNQSPAMAISRAYNEFADQMSLDLVSRLVSLGHICFPLDLRAHTHDFIFSCFRKLIYHDMNIINESGTSVGKQTLLDNQISATAAYLECDLPVRVRGNDDLNLRRNEPEKKLHFHFIAAKGTQACVDNARSKINLGTVSIFIDFVEEQILEKQIWNPNDWSYVTPYRGQAGECTEALNALIVRWNKAHPGGQITRRDLPDIVVGDTAQATQIKNVWYDVVTTDKLGCLADDRRVTTHVTQARDMLWIIADDQILDELKNPYLQRLKEDERPLLVRIVSWLTVHGCRVNKKARTEVVPVEMVRLVALDSEWWLTSDRIKFPPTESRIVSGINRRLR